MPLAKDIAALRFIDCPIRLDENAIGNKLIAGIIGDSPSQYSKSPALWNATFDHLGMNAIYVPLDVDDGTARRTAADPAAIPNTSWASTSPCRIKCA